MVNAVVDSASAMEQLGKNLAVHCEAGLIIYLQGELGMGKTTFTRGFLHGLGYQGHILSPTFNLFQCYQLVQKTAVHFDLYRLNDPRELEYIGAADYFDGKNICLIEWPQLGVGFLPPPDIHCEFSLAEGVDSRSVKFTALTTRGERALQALI
jgi:tRNA threonylcarbamoyladenosine biosynthesis protein TsaE